MLSGIFPNEKKGPFPAMAGAAAKEWNMSTTGKVLAGTAMAGLAALSLSGCATEDYVDQHIAVVNERVSALEATVQQVNATAQQANATAQAAQGAAQQANQRLDQLTPRVDAIEQQLARKRPRH